MRDLRGQTESTYERTLDYKYIPTVCLFYESVFRKCKLRIIISNKLKR